MSDFNLPLLRKAVEWAESEAARPEQECEWDQRYFMIAGEKIGRTCGTAYCVAGWILHEAGGRDGLIGDETMAAQALLGVDDIDAWGGVYDEPQGLFTARNTIEDVRTIAERIARKYGEEL